MIGGNNLFLKKFASTALPAIGTKWTVSGEACISAFIFS
jgi:hypothetical protein